MKEEPKSIWRKSWTGWRAFLLWFILFFVVFLIGLSLPIINLPNAGLFAVVFALITVLLIAFVRWVFCWRNLKRALFILVCVATLIALFYAEEDWRGKHDWEKFKREWEAKGEKFDFKDFVPPPVPDDQNFALTPIVFTSYGQVLTRDGKAISPDKRDTNFVNRLKMEIVHNYEESPKDGNWQTAKISDLKAWRDYYRALAATTNEFPVASQPQSPGQDILLALSKYDPAIEELRQVSQLPYSRFPLDYDIEDPAEILLPHLAALKQCSLALQLRAIAELQNGQSDKAFDDVKLSLRLIDSIHTEPFIISQLVRFAMFHIALQPVWEGLAEHKWSDTQLAGLDSELSKLDFPADYELSVRGERASDIKIVDWLEQNRSRYWPFLGMLENDAHRQDVVVENFAAKTAFYLMPKGWFYQNEIVLARLDQQWNFSAVDDAAQTISAKKTVQADKAVKSISHAAPFNLFACVLLPALGNYAQKTAYAQNAVNMARVAIALERYRLANENYPDSLDVLAPQFMEKIPHDIINGEPLHYRRTDDGQFVLYSVGWNETDDGGVVGLTTDGKNADNRKGDWVWRYPQK